MSLEYVRVSPELSRSSSPFIKCLTRFRDPTVGVAMMSWLQRGKKITLIETDCGWEAGRRAGREEGREE